MLRPSDTATRERKSLTGLWLFRLDGAGEGRSARWFDGPLPGAREMAVPASFNDLAADAAVHDHVGDVWYQTHGARAARLGRPAGRAATSSRRPTGPRSGSNDTEVVSHEGGYTPVRGRRHRRTSGAGDEARDHRRGQQHADLPDDPAGGHRGHPGRPAAALLARLLQLRRHPPPGLAVRDRPRAPDRHHGGHRARRCGRHRDLPDRGERRRRRRGPGRAARRRRRGGRPRHGGERHPDRAGACTAGRPATATSTTWRCSWSTAGTARSTTAGQLPPGRRGAHRRPSTATAS